MTQQEISRRLPELNVIWDHLIREDCWRIYRGYRLTGHKVVLPVGKEWPVGLLVCHMDHSPLHPDDTMYVEQPITALDQLDDSPMAVAKYLEVAAQNASESLQRLIDMAYAKPAEVPRPFKDYA